MNPILRGVCVYIFLLIIFRITGKKTLSQTSSFELVLLLIISEVTQQAMVGEDYSITGSLLLILTLVGTDLLLSILKNHFKKVEDITEGKAIIIVDHGKPLVQRMKLSRISEEDILQTARSNHGLERMEQIKFAVLENDGKISIIPKEP